MLGTWWRRSTRSWWDGAKDNPDSDRIHRIGRTAVDISAGGDPTCAVLDDGSVACWGANTYGQLGDGTTTSRTSPTQTLTLPRPAIAVEAGMHFTCALLDDGSIACWGRNHYGQLGRGYTNTSGEAQPTPNLTASMPS